MKLLAVLTDPFGTVPAPTVLFHFGDVANGGIGNLLNLVIKIIFVGGGIYALFNLLLAGYAFMGAGDDPKKIEGAWGKIWQTAMGLLFMAGDFFLSAIFWELIFNDYVAILNSNI